MSNQKQVAISDLWGDENSFIQLEDAPTKTKKVLDKINNPLDSHTKVETQLKSKKVSNLDKLNLIKDEVMRVLGHYKPNTLVIHSREELHKYIDACIKNKIIAIDTETNNSLDPITCLLMGGCIYTPFEKNCYIPVNHRNPITRERLDWQVTEQDIREEFQRLLDNNVYIIMHNGKFDYQVIKCTCGISIIPHWDTMICAKLIDENEQSAGLKQQYIDKIDKEQEKYDIEGLFKGVEYADVDPDIFALYSATDAYMTYKLYEWQKPIIDSADYKKIYNLFHNIEMPCVEVVAEMELNGIEFDTEYASRLNTKYTNKMEEIKEQINQEISRYRDKINAWRLTPDANKKEPKKGKNGSISYSKSKNEQLDEDINLSSPTQLAILLYDILGVEEGIGDTPRATGTEVLEKIDLPLCKLLIEYKELDKLISAFIVALPEKVNPKDGRIHCHFNQYGAGTGRFSSSDPNLQQIPSHNKEIRMLFKARDGYTLIGSDYSQQEPRMLANYSKDENMINAYRQGKDLYAIIASKIYKNDYWDNMEKTQNGDPNPEGKKRRGKCKGLLLGIMYGMGVASMATQINGTREEAQKIINDFYDSFPKVKKWVDKTISDAKKNGYVEDLWGRRRRLPDLLLQPFDITPVKGNQTTLSFNPFINCENKLDNTLQKIVMEYTKELENCKNKKDKDAVVAKALTNGFTVRDNGGFISRAERQCVNARIQGGSATMTKIAMNRLYRDEELRNLGFKLLIGVHDELIGECPKENADAVAERFTYLMKTAIEDVCDVPFKCDADICDRWYYNDYCDTIRKEIETLAIKNSVGCDDVFEEFAQEHCELKKEELRQILIN